MDGRRRHPAPRREAGCEVRGWHSGGARVTATSWPAVRLTPAMSQRVRRRSLGGDQRAGRTPEACPAKAARLHLAGHGCTWHSSPWRIAVVLGVTVALTPSSFMRGLIVGLGVAGTAGALWLWIVEATGTAPTMMGDLGEQWTARNCVGFAGAVGSVVNHVTLHRAGHRPRPGRPRRDVRRSRPSGRPHRGRSTTRGSGPPPRVPAGTPDVSALWQNLKPAQVAPGPFGGLSLGRRHRGTPREASKWPARRSCPGMQRRHGDRSWEQDSWRQEQIQAAWSALDAHCRKRDQVEHGPLPLAAVAVGVGHPRGLALTAACAAADCSVGAQGDCLGRMAFAGAAPAGGARRCIRPQIPGDGVGCGVAVVPCWLPALLVDTVSAL